MTRNQQLEIEFLSTKIGDWWERPFTPTEDEIDEFIAVTVHGQKAAGTGVFSGEANRLLQSKRLLDISVRAWQTDWNRFFFEREIREEIDHPYLDKIVRRIKRTIGGGYATSSG